MAEAASGAGLLNRTRLAGPGMEAEEEGDAEAPQVSATRRRQKKNKRPSGITPLHPFGNQQFLVTHGHEGAYRYAPPVDIGVNTDPLPSPSLKSMYIGVWMLLNLLTGLLCYTDWFRHQATPELGAKGGKLPKPMVNAFIAFWVLGAIVYFGVCLPVLFSTLNRDSYPMEVRNKRYYAIFLLWVLHDFPMFVIEFDAFVTLGLVNGFQTASFIFTLVSGVIPPWYIYLRLVTDKLHQLLDHHHFPNRPNHPAARTEPAQPLPTSPAPAPTFISAGPPGDVTSPYMN
eukprot:TRINITY_DN30560_c0_g1_i1.p1 TRINITY_DN30560_c0_g1~~TRINITY_DN30560_c0_g1_i1.p1  ORF type:complete len:304 (+),score=112.48 TRINITY_DN30560_c0_g1_i1:56-913(+)